MRVAVVALLLLTSCDRPAAVVAVRPDGAGARLERAAVSAGLVLPADDPSGLYGNDTDRVCVVRQEGGYRIGAAVDYGDDQGCGAIGSVAGGERLRVTLGADCRFDARFEGDRIVFPATLPAACDRLCSGRSSFAALAVTRLGASRAEAATMRLRDGSAPCVT